MDNKMPGASLPPRKGLPVVRDIVTAGLLGAILIVGQVAMAPLPNIEPVSLLVILYALHFRWVGLWAVYVFVLLEGFLYGFHIWWFSYLYVWLILYLVARLVGDKGSPLVWALVSGLFGLFFGAMCAVPYLFTGGPGGYVAYFVSGIPFDLLHAGGNFLLALALFKPMDMLLRRYRKLAGK